MNLSLTLFIPHYCIYGFSLAMAAQLVMEFVVWLVLALVLWQQFLPSWVQEYSLQLDVVQTLVHSNNTYVKGEKIS